jgi:hypothetical protein
MMGGEKVAVDGAFEEWKSFKTSAGVELRYGPFPGALYWDIMSRALREFPDPVPPKKIIEVLDGTEEIDNLDDPEYMNALAAARMGRHGILGEAALEMCVEIMTDWEPIVERLTDRWVVEPPPADVRERKLWFLSKYALRTSKDWSIIRKIRTFSQIEDEEVQQRIEFFRGDVEGSESPGPDASGPST